jgi:hypothetical protein
MNFTRAANKGSGLFRLVPVAASPCLLEIAASPLLLRPYCIALILPPGFPKMGVVWECASPLRRGGYRSRQADYRSR